MGSQVKEAAPPAALPEEEPRRSRWTIVQFVLAAASAVPLLWVGGLGGWPWDHKSATGNPAAAQDDPVRIQVSRLSIDAPIDPLALDSTTNELAPPGYGRAGWYQAGPRPGQAGRAIVEGHRTDPGGGNDIFAALGTAQSGDTIVLTTGGGKKVRFVVRSVESFDTSALPTDRLFGSDGTAQLRVIAPSGDVSGKSYQQDLVVFADLIG